MLIEGINTTEGTGGAGFYFDYSSLEEVFLGTSGQSAEMPNPGVQSQFIAQVGRQPVPGRVLPRLVQQLAAGREHPRRIHRARRRSTTRRSASTATRSIATTTTPSTSAVRSRRTRCGASAPIASSSMPWRSRTSSSTRRSTPSCGTRSARARTSSTRRTRSSATTSGARRSSRTVCRSGHLHLRDRRSRPTAGLGQLGLQGRMERHGQRQAVSRGALRRLRLLLPADHQQPRQLLLPRHRHADVSEARTRSSSSIAIASSTTSPPPTSSTPAKGSHTFKMGAEMLKEKSWEGLRRSAAAATSSTSTTTAPNQVIFDFPTATARSAA